LDFKPGENIKRLAEDESKEEESLSATSRPEDQTHIELPVI